MVDRLTLCFCHTSNRPPMADTLLSTSSPSPPVDLPLLLSRIREHVTVNRIRGSEFFQDFDPLRSGSIAASRFRQVIVTHSMYMYVLHYVHV